MNEQRNLTITLLPALLLVTLAGLVRFVIVEKWQMLPADHEHTLEYTAESQIRERIDGQMSVSAVSTRQVAQTLTVTGDVAIIQNNLYWYTQTGELIFQSSGLYGVDRVTRMNLPGYGDASRSGQFLFPPGILQEPFTFWDAMFIGPRQAEYAGVQVLDGLKLYQFNFTGTDMDETVGYSGLPDVPERYRVRTNGEGTLWIEPVTGILVNYEESGVSTYVDPVSNKNMTELFIWSDTFTPETRASQAALAHSGRLRILVYKILVPVSLLIAGLVWLLNGLLIGSRRPKGAASNQ
jgi:hypothetical protein